jgi:hypothetical protein
MGTDIFLSWHGMTESEKDEQLRASRSFRLDAGGIGYLRAAIGMKRENAFLRAVLPKNYWFNRTRDPIPFDFRKRLSSLASNAKVYLRSAADGTEPEFEDYAEVAMMDRVSNAMAERAGFQKVMSTDDLMFEEAKLWLTEVDRFFRLGVEKQDGGMNPKIFISW